jgi:hypothetical protein
MQVDVERQGWQKFLDGFSERNKARLTRLEVISKSGEVTTDFWLEDGLTLAGASLDKDVEGAPQVEIILDCGNAQDHSHMTRTVTRAQRVVCEADASGHDTALEVEDQDGNVTILRFE